MAAGEADLVTVAIPPELLEAIALRVADLVTAQPSHPSEEQPWIGVAQAAEHLACKPHRIYDLVRRQRVAFRRDGTRLLFRRSDLDRYLAVSAGREDL